MGKKVSGAVSYLDLVTAGAVKYFEERLLAGIVGNGTLKSGVIKLGIGYLARKFLGRGMLADAVSLGFGIDGTEDILMNVLGGAGVGGAEEW